MTMPSSVQHTQGESIQQDATKSEAQMESAITSNEPGIISFLLPKASEYESVETKAHPRQACFFFPFVTQLLLLRKLIHNESRQGDQAIKTSQNFFRRFSLRQPNISSRKSRNEIFSKCFIASNGLRIFANNLPASLQ